jgi:hypothetical protein
MKGPKRRKVDMDVSELDAHVADLRGDREALRDDLETLATDFVSATEEFVTQWALSEVERAVTSNPGVTGEHGIDGLRRLKADLNLILDEAPKIIEAHLDSDERWPHRSDPSLRPPGPLADALHPGFQGVVGHVGHLLQQYGYTGVDTAWEERHDAWPSYTAIVEWSDQWSAQMQTIESRYSELLNRYVELQGQLAESEKRRAEAEAKRLWDEA